MKERIISKGLVFAVIILFVGVSIQPAIAKVQAENIYVEYFDVTTEFIGLDKTYTTQLTKQEIEKLDALFNSINEHLNKSASFKDSIEIFKKVIFELNSFGLLGNVGVKETEKIVIGHYQNKKLIKNLYKVYDKEKNPLEGDKNLFCLIAGKSTGTFFSNFRNLGLVFSITIILIKLFPNSYFQLFGFTIGLTLLSLILDTLNPLCLGRQMLFSPDTYGKVLTCGLNGNKYWEGNLEGKIKCLILNNTYKAAAGFTGLKIQIVTNPNSYYLGFAILVDIDTS